MTKTILIIDDVPANKTFLAFVIKRAGYEVVGVDSGEQACDWLAVHTPVLVLCDIMLPGMDGIEVLKYMKSLEHQKNVPAIAITALALEGDKERLLAAGFDDYIAKPIYANDLLNTVKRILL